jgi:ankyrin repeat protein
MEASQNGHQDIVQALLAAKGDVNAKNNNGNTALSYASIYGHQKTVELLKEAGAEQ